MSAELCFVCDRPGCPGCDPDGVNVIPIRPQPGGVAEPLRGRPYAFDGEWCAMVELPDGIGDPRKLAGRNVEIATLQGRTWTTRIVEVLQAGDGGLGYAALCRVESGRAALPPIEAGPGPATAADEPPPEDGPSFWLMLGGCILAFAAVLAAIVSLAG